MPKTKADINIENVVASAKLEHTVDLDAIMISFPTAEYRPEVFPGLVFRLKEPKATTLIFRTGKMVCTGAKSETQAVKAVERVVKELKSHGIVIRGKATTKIQNIVASVNLHGRIDLERAVYRLRRTVYEPEQFPGLIYRMDEPKVVILIFATGKLVCTGAKKEEDVFKSVDKLHQQLEDEKLMRY